ncbi:WAT1-related protein [Camellia lanceoleosa]|uniref:WAT1-related protein n=1 Tax=Camellia lanceoleosa TaxID=1840588 RepID=A0ACC0G6M9_9ERIC|nr:WAT1-related protein [Camellia lanceoleosa]
MLKGGVVPCLMMVTMEACNIVLTIKASTTMSREGMSPLVFVAYTNILSSFLLLPSSFLFHNHSILGAAIVGMEYYTVMWGQIRADETHIDHHHHHGIMDSSEDKVPLLEGDSQV